MDSDDMVHDRTDFREPRDPDGRISEEPVRYVPSMEPGWIREAHERLALEEITSVLRRTAFNSANRALSDALAQDEAVLFSVAGAAATNGAIACVFIFKFHAPPEEFWRDEKTIGRVLKELPWIPHGSHEKVSCVCRDVLSCVDNGVEYDPNPSNKRGQAGDRAKIDIASCWAQMIADYMESGLSLASTWSLLNVALKKENLETVGLSAVVSCYHRLMPFTSAIVGSKQGSLVENNWSRARHRWVVQLLLRFGKLHDKKLEWFQEQGLVDKAAAEIPACFDKAKLSPIDPTKVAWWDETHEKIQIGYVSGSGVSVRFLRDPETGKLDPINGVLSDDDPHKTVEVKFPGEWRACLGVYMTLENPNDPTSTLVGRTLPIFDYTNRTLETKEDWDRKVKEEIDRVKVGPPGIFCVDPRTPGELFGDDPVLRLPNVGPEKVKKLGTIGVRTIADLTCLTAAKLADLRAPSGLPAGISRDAFDALLVAARLAAGPSAPKIVDHRKADNPYESLYGPTWEDELDKLPKLKGTQCITRMITHIFTTSEEAIGADYLVCHDALSLMAANSTKAWMSEHKDDYLKHWILPQFDLNKGILNYGRVQPVGNSPELQPMDCNLNADLKHTGRRHFAMSQSLPDTDPRKFRKATPTGLRDSYHRLWSAGCLSSERIVQDISKVFANDGALFAILANRGCLTEEGKRLMRGVRRVAVQDQAAILRSSRGGARKRRAEQDEKAKWWHPDLDSVIKESTDLSFSKFASRKKARTGGGSSSESEHGDRGPLLDFEPEEESWESETESF